MKLLYRTAATCLLFLVACNGFAQDETIGQNVDDTWLHTQVKAALIGYGSANVNVEVDRGVVQLAGFVKSDTERQAAEQQIANIEGVKRISNQLIVSSGERTAGRIIDDGVLAGKIKFDLVNPGADNNFRVNVEVNNGNVLLSGFVPTEADRKHALDVVSKIKGVAKVYDGMDVKAAKGEQ